MTKINPDNIDWEYEIRLQFYENTQSITLEQLYQLFKERMNND